jgi:hypothetical protein
MTREEIIKIAQEAGWNWPEIQTTSIEDRLERFTNLVAAAERKELEVELLKLARGVASTSDYIQGRWDLIGEFQDVIRARGNHDPR